MLFDTTQLALERSISGAAQRQEALAANIANASTPGYQRKDVDFHGALQQAMTGGVDALKQTGFAAQQTGDGAVRPDGGTVDVDREASELAKNGLEYQALTSVISTRDSILRAAMGRQ